MGHTSINYEYIYDYSTGQLVWNGICFSIFILLGSIFLLQGKLKEIFDDFYEDKIKTKFKRNKKYGRQSILNAQNIANELGWELSSSSNTNGTNKLKSNTDSNSTKKNTFDSTPSNIINPDAEQDTDDDDESSSTKSQQSGMSKVISEVANEVDGTDGTEWY